MLDDAAAFKHLEEAIELLDGYEPYYDIREDLIIVKEKLEKKIWR